MSLLDSYPRPRVGQHVVLYDNRVAVVLAVHRANALLRLMCEEEAIGCMDRFFTWR